ncbi:MAG TPA: cytidine deaminase [Trebonia sp.]
MELRKRDDAEARELCQAACAAAELAYAKYSRFRVGAALVTANGIYTGANVENASYNLGLCAERSAISRAVTAGDRDLVRIAVACIDASPRDGVNAAMPCGGCRQWFVEFAPDLEVLVWTPGGDIYTFTARDLLAVPFVLD